MPFNLNDWGAWRVGHGFAEAVRQVLFADKGNAPKGQVSWKTLDQFKTNARELKGPVKGIVVEHPWLGAAKGRTPVVQACRI